MEDLITLSIVVCTYNRQASLRRCIQALLDTDTTQRWELVVVDNNSTDGTAEFLRSIPSTYKNVECKVIFEKRQGQGIARNTGWQVTRGAIVGFTDDDCYVSRDYISCLIDCFGEDPKLAVLGGRILLYDPEDLRITIMESEQKSILGPRTFVAAGTVQGANMAFRREVLEHIGGFDEKFGPGTAFVCDDIDAVAATLWAGFAGAYDPRPTVYHHHGRRTVEDREKIFRTYDAARGAYFAKYILKKESRATYLRAWMRSVKSDLRAAPASVWHGGPMPLRNSIRELYSAIRYFRSL
jgi:GT2 family glycosyltransferase